MKAALVEFNNYHTECLYSQLLFLKEERARVTLIINPRAKKNVEDFIHLADEVYFYDKKIRFPFVNKAVHFFKLLSFLRKGNYDKIIFNTASSSKTLILLTTLLKYKKNELIGTLHNLKKINHSHSQKFINKNIHKFFVINDFLLQSIKKIKPELRVSSYYPVFFPDFKDAVISKPENEIWICVPGEVNFKRRDYDIIIKSLLRTVNKDNLKFIILGKINSTDGNLPDGKAGGKIFNEKLQEHNLSGCFITFNHYVENPLFFSYLKASDYVMANLQIKDDSYLKYKTSGVFNIALGLKKPLIANTKLNFIEELSHNSYFYENEKDLAGIFDRISAERHTASYKEIPKLSFQHQQKNYISFLNSARV